MLTSHCDTSTGHCRLRRPLPGRSATLYHLVKFSRATAAVKRVRRGSHATGGLAHSDDEQARKAEQHLAVEPWLVGGGDLLRVGGEKFLARGGVERREIRLQRRTSEPFDDGLRRRQHMLVDRVPDVDLCARRLEQVVIDFRRR